MLGFIRNFGKKWHTIEILYKSGHKKTIRCSSYKVEWNTAEGRCVGLTINDGSERFVFAGINNIESIWEI